MRGLPSINWLLGILLCLLVLSSMRLGILSEQQTAATTAEGGSETAHTLEPAVTVVPVVQRAVEEDTAVAVLPDVPQPPNTLADTIGSDDSIYLSLKGLGLSEGQLALLGEALELVFDADRASQPGDFYTLEIDGDGRVVHFVYTPRATPEHLVVVERQDGELVGRRHRLPLESRVLALDVAIEDNLSNAMAVAVEGDVLTDWLADDIFGSVIDFHRDPRRGDRLGVVFESLYKDGRFVRHRRVLLARYSGQMVSRLAVYYQLPQGSGAYYDDRGVSLERMFLIKPLPFRRISSGFSRRRFHPILRKNVPHLGTDYAAGSGTEVWATARGRVTHAGLKGGFGKMVEIEHPNGYRTRYAHLRRVFVRRGQQVSKRDPVGQVGSTGRATGPHLHYELLRNGKHMDPVRANRGSQGRPLQEDHLRSFARRRDDLLRILDSAADTGLMVAAGEPP